MSPEDRERQFEDALAGHVRSNRVDAPGDLCANAELLAAYHDGSLSPEQIPSLKAHISDCARCQEVLAFLEATDEIPLLAAGPEQAEAVVAPSKSSVRILALRKPPLWRWVAPAGALAAALLVWVAVRENNSIRVPPQAPIVNSKASEPVKDLRSSSKPEQSTASTYAAHTVQALPPRSEAPTLPRELAIPATRDQRPRALRKDNESLPANKKSETENFAQFLENSPDSNALSALDSKIKSDAGAKASTNGRDVSNDAISPSALSPTTSPSAVAGRAGGVVAGVIAPAPAPQPPPAAQEQFSHTNTGPVRAQVLPKEKEKAGVRLASGVSEITVSAPDDRVSWRIGQAGVIELSPDGGKTWTLQPSGVITDLLAGSAPSDQVCWIVGRAGTILRTTDGGAHWQKLRSPTQDDLLSIFAVNARRATISLTNADYETKDGGATWNKLPAQ
jgi:hypothetical protein